ncbi:response regulator, partial [Candidatus Poribacteria bacterium]|nr:response regulator [Candidatus Poribacteria bacterium]
MINMIGAQAKAMLLRKFFETHLTTMNEIIGPKVLIVDDDVNNIRRLRDVLEPEGYRILIASDGGTALKIAERSLPDIILLDI